MSQLYSELISTLHGEERRTVKGCRDRLEIALASLAWDEEPIALVAGGMNRFGIGAIFLTSHRLIFFEMGGGCRDAAVWTRHLLGSLRSW